MAVQTAPYFSKHSNGVSEQGEGEGKKKQIGRGRVGVTFRWICPIWFIVYMSSPLEEHIEEGNVKGEGMYWFQYFVKYTTLKWK